VTAGVIFYKKYPIKVGDFFVLSFPRKRESMNNETGKDPEMGIDPETSSG